MRLTASLTLHLIFWYLTLENDLPKLLNEIEAGIMDAELLI